MSSKRKQEKEQDDGIKKQKQEEDPSTNRIQSLETAYRKALKAFKADKSNKDLRRARSAAKKAWDDAVVEASGGGEPLTCRDCSQMFLFFEREKYVQQGWDHVPTRCDACSEKHKDRFQDRSKRDTGKNMCYDFQRTGECSRGDRCKFSHDPNHAGRTQAPPKPICFAFRKGNCHYGDKCNFRHCLEVTADEK